MLELGPMLASGESKPQWLEQRPALGPCRLLHRRGPGAPRLSIPRLRRQETRRDMAKLAALDDGSERSVNHLPPIFRVAEHGEIAAHGLPEPLVSADPHGLEPPGHGG